MRDEAIYTEKYKGLTINIYQDSDAQNPWKDWDGEPPLAVYSDRSITEYGEEYGNVNNPPALTRDQIKANLKEIMEMLELKSVFSLRVHHWNMSLEDTINEFLADYVNDQNNSDRLEALETLYNMAGQPALLKTVRGYSQGDWAEVLAVATPEFIKATGAPYTKPEDLKNDIQLFQDWAYGNVYGYVVEDENGEHVDSCWGFFGDYDAEYSALSNARENADYHVEAEKGKHFKQVKQWIKNHVPLIYRTHLA